MDLAKVCYPHSTTRSYILTCEEIATTLDLSPTETAGPSKIGSLTVHLAIQPDDEPAIKGKQRMLSELKEDARLKLADKLHPEAESSGQVSASSDLSKSLNRILSVLSAMSNIADAASKVCYILSLRMFNSHLLIKVHPTVDNAWSTITLLRKVDFLFDKADTRT